MKNRWWLVFALGLVAGSAIAADEIAVSPQQAAAFGIRTAPLAPRPAIEGVALPARVAVPPAQLRVVAAPLPALVESVEVAVNDTVRQGQTLARLLSPALVEAERTFLAAAIDAQLARESLQRDRRLLDEGIIAESRYLASRSRDVAARALLAERRQALRLVGVGEAAIDRLAADHRMSATITLTAPVDGIVSEQAAVPGERVEAAAPLFRIVRPGALWLEIQTPLATAARLAAGAGVVVPRTGTRARVLSVGTSVDPSTQNVLVRARVVGGAEQLRAGQFVEAAFTDGGQAARHWSVPSRAVVRRDGRTWVFVAIDGGFRPAEVKVLSETAEQSTIAAAGLAGNERIAVDGMLALKGRWQGFGGGG